MNSNEKLIVRKSRVLTTLMICLASRLVSAPKNAEPRLNRIDSENNDITYGRL